MALETNRRRRIIMPLIILIVGGGIAWWASQQETEQIGAMRAALNRLCLAAAKGEDIGPFLPVQDQYLRRQLEQLLPATCSAAAEQPDLIKIDLLAGDLANSCSHTTTHSAIIRVSGVNVLGLCCETDDTGFLITGYWLPQEE